LQYVICIVFCGRDFHYKTQFDPYMGLCQALPLLCRVVLGIIITEEFSSFPELQNFQIAVQSSVVVWRYVQKFLSNNEKCMKLDNVKRMIVKIRSHKPHHRLVFN